MSDNNEVYPKEWIKLSLAINISTLEVHVLSGDRYPGEGDTGYIGLDLLKDKGLEL